MKDDFWHKSFALTCPLQSGIKISSLSRDFFSKLMSKRSRYNPGIAIFSISCIERFASKLRDVSELTIDNCEE